MTARVIAVCNQKGGVGKTTTTFNLARSVVRAGRRALLVDADPQGNLTEIASAVALPETTPGLADVLSSRVQDTVDDVVVPTGWDRCSLIPTRGEALGDVRDELVVAGAGREGRLRTALAPVADDFDVILIDCPPTLDQLTINALTAAHAVAVVTHTKLFSASGLGKLLDTISVVTASYNPTLHIGGVIVNAHEARTLSGRHWMDEIAGSGVDVLHPPIPKLAVINDAAEAGQGLDQWPSTEARILAELYDGYLAALVPAVLSDPTHHQEGVAR